MAIVETLKEFRNILFGQQIIVHTDHKNLTCKNFNTERVMRWRLILEEFGPELRYIKGENNVVADALSRLEMTPDKISPEPAEMAENFALEEEDLPKEAYPLSYKKIQIHQQKDEELLQKAMSKDNYAEAIFHGGGKERHLIVKDGKIVMPKTLQTRCVNWYHEVLCHPGMTRTEQTIRQHFTWKNLRKDVEKACKSCKVCQLTKRKSMAYGKLPPKVA